MNIKDIKQQHFEKYITNQLLDLVISGTASSMLARCWESALLVNVDNDTYCRGHDIRGQYVDIMHYCGIPTEYISKEVGHSNTATTSNIYTQFLNEVPIEANQRMDK